ncbi:peptidase [Flexivirga endophytica]|uniref:Peptidase n=1 Tax=Flexivirga endophytica TaxID=1849103 RepID=A0A916TCQ2_9MICO|nr:peptidase [Flexivirga endophytica]GHB47869.1 peptidase [Flexivirga endophytica]
MGVLFLLGVIILLLGIGVSIALHELGHLTPAKLFGVKVTQYMVGFGPTIWSRRRGETEYGLKAIPLGGYIRMIGMFPPRPGEEAGFIRASSTGRFSQLADQMREDAYEHISPRDADRVFYKLPTWKKVVIMFGGPFMNLVIALLLLILIASGIGLPVQQTANIAAVQSCSATATGEAAADCDEAGRTAAAAAGVKPGDRIVSIDGTKITSTTDFTDIVRSHPRKQIPLVVERDGRHVTLQVTPKLQRMPKQDSSGTQVVNWKGEVEYENVGVIGASIGGTYQDERQSLPAALGTFGDALQKTSSVFLKIPQKMVGVWNAAFSGGTRDQYSPQSVVGVGRTAGDVTESKYATTQDKIVVLLMILASLNMALFVFNLVPLLPLDGGHIAGALWEAVKRRIARLRGKTGPVYVDVAKALPLAYGVSIVLLVMFALLAYADIVNPVKLG